MSDVVIFCVSPLCHRTKSLSPCWPRWNIVLSVSSNFSVSFARSSFKAFCDVSIIMRNRFWKAWKRKQTCVCIWEWVQYSLPVALRVCLHQAWMCQCCDGASDTAFMKTMESTHLAATPLFSMRTVSLASLQHCRSDGADVRCKQTLTVRTNVGLLSIKTRQCLETQRGRTAIAWCRACSSKGRVCADQQPSLPHWVSPDTLSCTAWGFLKIQNCENNSTRFFNHILRIYNRRFYF